jgi:hypothetical protein
MNFGINVEIDWNKFLKIETDKILYKSDFKSFSDLYEYIIKNLKDIKNILFDGQQLFLRNGLLHNLYEPALIKYFAEPLYGGNKISNNFFINGQEVYVKGNLCKKLTDFENGQIYFVLNVNLNLKTRYEKHHINLIELRKIEIRENKLKRILK